MLILRSLTYQTYFWLMSAVMTLAHFPLLVFSRKFFIRRIRRWSEFTLWGLRTFAGLGVEIRGAEHIPQGGALIASKHQSMWETVMLFVLLKDPAIIIKKELTWVPLYGWYCLKARMIVVDRGAHAKALRGLMRDSKSRFDEGRQILIFPEGTRMPVGAQPDYKSGIAAIYAQVNAPCVPVAVNSGLYWPKGSFLRYPGKVLIEFLPPIEPGLKRPDFMERLESSIEIATDRLVSEGRGSSRNETLKASPVDNSA
jgi:1-acyl-sn-glycerol-3-phosphate acyltransferase